MVLYQICLLQIFSHHQLVVICLLILLILSSIEERLFILIQSGLSSIEERFFYFNAIQLFLSRIVPLALSKEA